MQRKTAKRKIKAHMEIVRRLGMILRRMRTVQEREPAARKPVCHVYYDQLNGHVDAVHRALAEHDYKTANKKVKQADRVVGDLLQCARKYEEY